MREWSCRKTNNSLIWHKYSYKFHSFLWRSDEIENTFWCLAAVSFWRIIPTITNYFYSCFFQRGNQTVSRICKFIFVGIFIFLAISLIISLAGVLKYLDFLYFCSYVKLFITLIKYVPQAYLNFRRKSTFGWSIGNILLDFTGGFLSIGQMFVISYNESKFFINYLLI